MLNSRSEIVRTINEQEKGEKYIQIRLLVKVSDNGNISIADLKSALREQPLLFFIPTHATQSMQNEAKKFLPVEYQQLVTMLGTHNYTSCILDCEHLRPVAFNLFVSDQIDDEIDIKTSKLVQFSIHEKLAQNLVHRTAASDCDAILSEMQLARRFSEFLHLRPLWTVEDILSYLVRRLHSGAAFTRLTTRSCYFGYAPVLEAEVSYRDFFPAFSSWSGAPFAIDIGAGIAGPDEESPALRMLDSLLSGAFSGALSRTCTAPLDRLKVMRQVYGYQHAGSSALDAFRWMLREGGFRSLWRGNGVSVVKIAPETAVKYTAYGFYKDLVAAALPQAGDSTASAESHHHQQLPLYEKFLAGSLAGATSQSLIYPLEVVKTRMCLRKTGQYGGGGIANCLATVYREGGIRALYRGYSVTLAGILPYAGIELATYETARGRLHGVTGGALISGALASSLGIVTCYPLALLRTKLQSKVRFSRPELNSVRGLAGAIYQAEGAAGFYRGMGANLTKVLPSVAISFAVFERLNLYLHFGHTMG